MKLKEKELFRNGIKFILILFITACNPNTSKELPIYGEIIIDENGDSLNHTIPDFLFYNQNGEKVTKATFENSIYVADFFFSRCPSICPIMSNQMNRVQSAFIDDNELKILSHTVDPENDTIPALRAYANKIGAIDGKWHLVTGDKRKLHGIANQGYHQVAGSTSDPSSLLHSEYFVLIDKDKQVRGYYNGVDSTAVDSLIRDIKTLKATYNGK